MVDRWQGSPGGLNNFSNQRVSIKSSPFNLVAKFRWWLDTLNYDINPWLSYNNIKVP